MIPVNEYEIYFQYNRIFLEAHAVTQTWDGMVASSQSIRLGMEGLLVRDSLEALYCVLLEQETLFSA